MRRTISLFGAYSFFLLFPFAQFEIRREFSRESNHFKLTPVKEFTEHGLYYGGSLSEFSKMTGLTTDVLYFGDSITSDITGPFQSGQWKTCAIVPELENEIIVNNDRNFQKLLLILIEIEHLMFDSQVICFLPSFAPTHPL